MTLRPLQIMTKRPLHIVIVDDEEAHAEGIRRSLLKEGGFSAEVCYSLEEYRRHLQEAVPDLVLMDLNLPDGNALEALVSPPDSAAFPILVITSLGSEHSAVEAMKGGALDYIVKSPQSFDEMPKTIHRALREWKLIKERNQAEAQVRMLARFPEEDPNPVLRLDGEGVVLYANQASNPLLDSWRSHRNTSVPVEWRNLAREALQKGMRQEREVSCEGRVFSLILVPIPEAGYVNIYGMDITKRLAAEETIQQSLREKDILLREVHHRVKNNLTIITSLLDLQLGLLKTKEKALEAFKESRDRVFAMALIHEQLYQSRNYVEIEIASFMEKIANHLLDLYGRSKDVSLSLDTQNIYLDINTAIPFGLILNELITNALKHAFADGRSGKVAVVFKSSSESDYDLVVADNGIGLPEQYGSEEADSLGLKIVYVLARQIEGDCLVSREKGTSFRVRFKTSTVGARRSSGLYE